jgi:glycosyltransferase involved in cell wall biosynthesis
VVVPTYNRAADLGRCLDSLVRQTYWEFEVIVCDDGSTDNTREVVDRYANRLALRYDWAENFGGPARPRNAGLRLARGEYVALLDSDDWWCPDKLLWSVRVLDRGADVVYHDLYQVKSRRQRFFFRTHKSRALRAPAFDELIRVGNVVPNSSVVLRAALLKAVGGFSEDPTLIAWEDYDAWLRVAKLTSRFERLPQTLGYYWLGGGNTTSPARTIRNLERFRELYIAGSANGVRAEPAWYHYMLGLAHHQLGSHRHAIGHLRRVNSVRGGLSPRQYARALLTAAASMVHVVAGAANA